jgi:hypothetical protein
MERDSESFQILDIAIVHDAYGAGCCGWDVVKISYLTLIPIVVCMDIEIFEFLSPLACYHR